MQINQTRIIKQSHWKIEEPLKIKKKRPKELQELQRSNNAVDRIHNNTERDENFIIFEMHKTCVDFQCNCYC